jgi:TetR/AcrR family transcriptional regulator, lmrAB and yxaGH operons repressor
MNATREQIIATTSSLLERQGYHATGINQIIRESGAPKGSLYYYFPAGKEELTAEAIEHNSRLLADHTRSELAAVAEPAAAIQGFIRRLAAHVQASACQAGAPIAAVALETAATSDRLAAACSAAYASLHTAFREKLLQGGVAPESAASLATLTLAAIEGGIVLTRAQRSAAPLEQIADQLHDIVRATTRQSRADAM